MVRGTIRDHVTHQRRPFVRFFGCEQDLSHALPHDPKTDLTPEFLSRISIVWPGGHSRAIPTAAS